MVHLPTMRWDLILCPHLKMASMLGLLSVSLTLSPNPGIRSGRAEGWFLFRGTSFFTGVSFLGVMVAGGSSFLAGGGGTGRSSEWWLCGLWGWWEPLVGTTSEGRSVLQTARSGVCLEIVGGMYFIFFSLNWSVSVNVTWTTLKYLWLVSSDMKVFESKLRLRNRIKI